MENCPSIFPHFSAKIADFRLNSCIPKENLKKLIIGRKHWSKAEPLLALPLIIFSYCR
jgi:hypothetical protein